MKRKGIIALVIGMVMAALVTLTACGVWSSDEKFPYDVAQERGYSGSRESFLADGETPTTELRRLYEEVLADGSFSGSYFEFLQAIGVKEDNGAYVQSALRSVVSVVASFSTKYTASYSYGAGIIYSLDKAKGDALIVTNYHVIYNVSGTGRETVPYISDGIELFPYGWEYSEEGIQATFLGGAMECDIAVLKVENSPLLKESENNPVYLEAAVACDSDSVTVGERVYAIGNAEGMGMSVTEGVVSVASEYARFYAADEKSTIDLPEIRISAAVNHGNSGGGLFNASGELMGIVNGRSEEDGVVGFGFALPANYALSVAQNVIDTCTVSPKAHSGAKAYMGITQTVEGSRGVYNEQTGKFYVEQKLVVTGVLSGGAAEKAGFTPGDTLISAKLSTTRGGAPFEMEVYFTSQVKMDILLFNVRRGDTVLFTVSRGGRTLELSCSFSGNSDFRTLA